MGIGRNEPCHCGSGKKYKKCCSASDEAAAAAERAAQAAARAAAADAQALQTPDGKPSSTSRNTNGAPTAPPKGLPSKPMNMKRKRAV